MIGDFHFLRPEWLLALLPALLIWRLLLRRGDSSSTWRGVVAPHLLPALLGAPASRSRVAPVHLIALGWLVAIVAVAGPSWKREPSPFADDTAALAVVIKVSPDMLADDVQPTRLARSVQKLHDLLAARGAAKTALVAYSGSAHLVMPATHDASIVELFAGSLDPKIMPSEGDAPAEAFRLADQALAQAGGGSILWIADSVSPAAQADLARWRSASSTPVRLLAPLPASADTAALRSAAGAAHAGVVPLTADDTDIRALARASRFAPAAGDATDTRWADSGYWLTPLLALLLLPFFRRGWMAPTAAVER